MDRHEKWRPNPRDRHSYRAEWNWKVQRHHRLRRFRGVGQSQHVSNVGQVPRHSGDPVEQLTTTTRGNSVMKSFSRKHVAIAVAALAFLALSSRAAQNKPPVANNDSFSVNANTV